MKLLKYASPYNYTALALGAVLLLIFGIFDGQSVKQVADQAMTSSSSVE